MFQPQALLTLRPWSLAPAALLVACSGAPPAEHAARAGQADHASHAEHASHAAHASHAGHVDHAEHQRILEEVRVFTRAEADYPLPALTLADQAGQPFELQSLTASDRPVALNFIFTTCTTICPVMTATFAATREELGADAERVKMVSMSIDPHNDTPAVLAAYAKKFDAPDDWTFVTGAPEQIVRILGAFDADFVSKVDHEPLTFIHQPGADDRWVRLQGLGGAQALAAEIRRALDRTP